MMCCYLQVREAQLAQFNYILVVGAEEEAQNLVSCVQRSHPMQCAMCNVPCNVPCAMSHATCHVERSLQCAMCYVQCPMQCAMSHAMCHVQCPMQCAMCNVQRSLQCAICHVQVNVRTRDNVVHGTKSLTEFIEELKKEVAEFH